jgi:hypothetical protein
LAGVDRLTVVLALPIITLILFETWWHAPGSALFLFLSALTLVYLPCVKWLAAILGLRMRTQLIAVVTTVLLLAAWAGVPSLAVSLLSQFHLDRPAVHELALVVSPVEALRAIQKIATSGRFTVPGAPAPFRALGLHFAIYIGLWFLFRLRCLRNVDRRLGRIPPPGMTRASAS